jgi:hypothetical protein
MLSISDRYVAGVKNIYIIFDFQLAESKSGRSSSTILKSAKKALIEAFRELKSIHFVLFAPSCEFKKFEENEVAIREIASAITDIVIRSPNSQFVSQCLELLQLSDCNRQFLPFHFFASFLLIRVLYVTDISEVVMKLLENVVYNSKKPKVDLAWSSQTSSFLPTVPLPSDTTKQSTIK